MKTLLRLSALLAGAPLFAEPALHIDTGAFNPETTIKLTFDQAVVKNDQIGKTVENTILRIEPAVEGHLKWTEPNVASFVRTGVPAIASTFTFSLPEGLIHLDGSAIPPGKLRTLTSAPFVYEYGYWRGTTRTPRYFVRFNDEVDPGSVVSHLEFVDKKGNRVAADVRRGIYGDLNTPRALGPTWSQRFEKGHKLPDPSGLDPNTSILSAVTVTPVHPLPVGESWRLAIKPGLPNAAGTAAITRETGRWIGSVRPFEVASIRAVTRVDNPRYISIGLSKALPENVTADAIKEFVTIEPVPPGMEIEAKRSLISIRGEYEGSAKWKVTVKRGLLAADGLAMTESKSEEIKFEHLSPILAVPSYAAAQLAKGSRTYNVDTVNIAAARIRVKRLAGEDAIRTIQGYRHYSGDGPGRERIKDRHTLPWSLVAGEPIYDKRLELDNGYDTSRRIELNWNEVLGEDKPSSLLFVSIEGDPKEGVKGTGAKKKLTQVFLQLTDIGLAWPGLAWKLNEDTAFLYAYSC